jgi:hypothetical protein
MLGLATVQIARFRDRLRTRSGHARRPRRDEPGRVPTQSLPASTGDEPSASKTRPANESSPGSESGTSGSSRLSKAMSRSGAATRHMRSPTPVKRPTASVREVRPDEFAQGAAASHLEARVPHD